MGELHEKFMRRCIELASFAKAKGKAAVGSVVVKDGIIIGEGIEGDEDYPGLIAHSEIIALIKAVEYNGGYDLSNCILYTTVEPCFMCSYATRRTKISTVVYGVEAGEIGGASSAFPFLISNEFKRWDSAPKVISGVLKEECSRVLSQ